MDGGTCKGCKRTTEHITNWSSYSDLQREKIINKLWPDMEFPPINLYNAPKKKGP